MRDLAFRETDRCRFCYYRRLTAMAPVARVGKFDAFTSTLLYSKFQNHELIKELGQLAVREVGVPFYYEDFRQGWADGQKRPKSWGFISSNTAAASSASETGSCSLNRGGCRRDSC